MTPFSTVDPGMMVLAAGLWVNVGVVISAKDAMVNTPLPTAPFKPTRGLSVPGPWGKTQSASTMLTGVDSQQKIGLPRSSCSFNDSYSSALALPLHQPLLPFYKVSPIRVTKLNKEMLTHPDQSFVTYVLDGLQNGFRAGFDPASVS